MSFIYSIDIAGACNLRCPSCPVGNSPDANRPTGLMSTKLFTEIVRKIRKDTPKCTRIQLYNWTDPTLHPELPEFIRIARKHRLKPSLSTNLNLFRNMDNVIKAYPKSIRVSISGFHQETYSRTHVRGKIETVIDGMRQLRASVDKHQGQFFKKKTKLKVLYHCYRDNLGDNYQRVEALCKELGF